MNCMRCGRETAEGQVFCPECLADMENYPVKPGTVIRLPRRREDPVLKKQHFRRKVQAAPEEQVKSLRKAVRALTAALVLALLLLAVTAYFAVKHLLENQKVFLPGQNYSAMISTEPSDAE